MYIPYVKLSPHRKAFSMITAIIVVLLMASVGAMVMSLSGKMVKETTTQFQKEQAILLAKSYTEFAVMAVSANGQRSTKCINTIQSKPKTPILGLYTIKIDISYLSNNKVLPNNLKVTSKCNNELSINIKDPKSPLSIIVDAYVSYKDTDNRNGQTFTYHRRSLQKI